MVLASEMGELVDPFRFLTEEESNQLPPETLSYVKDEIADLYQVLVYLCHKLGLDPLEACEGKLKKLEARYPISFAYGKKVKAKSAN